MIKIEIKSTAVETKSGISGRTQKPYNIREQTGYAHLYSKDGQPLPYPVAVRLSLDDGQFPHNPGLYQLDPSCLYVDRYQSLAIARPKLIPLASVAAVPASKAA